MSSANLNSIFFIGIGGIGMSALARYFMAEGKTVVGYDRARTPLTDQLVAEGASIHFVDELENIPEGVDLVIYTPAIPKGHKQLNHFQQNDYIVMKRSEILQQISASTFTIAVAGSHGKTTVTAMIAHILKHSGFGCRAFVGGILSNYNTNFIYQAGKDIVVIEADEFDRSFHKLSPDIAVITTVDTDHLDIYGSRENIEAAYIEFAQKLKDGGLLVLQSEISILPHLADQNQVTYSLVNNNADLIGITESPVGTFLVKAKYEDSIFDLNVPGYHNIENALAAIAVCRSLDIPDEKIEAAIKDFKGIKRRFEYLVNTPDQVFIDDYAHHPEEIRAFVSSVKALYPHKKITAIFQPHLFSRTQDLADGFGESLSMADEVMVLDIYPARELPIEGVTAQLIIDKIDHDKKYQLHKDELLGWLSDRDTEVLLTIGAGDIDKLVQPIKNLLESRKTTANS